MSFDLIKRVLESVHDVTPAEKLILVSFANFARQSGKSWPATATIAAMCGLSDRQTRRHIEALKKSGHIKESGWSKIRTKVYALNLPDRTCATGDRTPMTGDRTPATGDHVIDDRSDRTYKVSRPDMGDRSARTPTSPYTVSTINKPISTGEFQESGNWEDSKKKELPIAAQKVKAELEKLRKSTSAPYQAAVQRNAANPRNRRDKADQDHAAAVNPADLEAYWLNKLKESA